MILKEVQEDQTMLRFINESTKLYLKRAQANQGEDNGVLSDNVEFNQLQQCHDNLKGQSMLGELLGELFEREEKEKIHLKKKKRIRRKNK